MESSISELSTCLEGATHLANFHLVISNTTIIFTVVECYCKSACNSGPQSSHLRLLGSIYICLRQHETQKLIPKSERGSVTWSFLD